MGYAHADQSLRGVDRDMKTEGCEARTLVALVVGAGFGVIVGVATLAVAYPIFQSKEWASWVQAIGSIGAIIGAIAISKRTFDSDRKLRLEAERRERIRVDQGYRAVVLHLAEEAMNVVQLMKSSDVSSLISSWKIGRRSTAYACLSAFNSIPIYDLGSAERIKWAFFLKEEVEIFFWNVDCVKLTETAHLSLAQFIEIEVPRFVERINEFYQGFEATYAFEN